ncbi:MAG: hypothetical protein Kow0098_25980 [Ignavibacteriaceae bacterium]
MQKLYRTTFNLLILIIFTAIPVMSQPGWYSLNSGTTNDLKSVMFADALTGYVTGVNGTVLKTTDGGLNWIPLSVGSSQNINALYVFDADNVVIVGDLGFAAYTTDGGSNWNSVSTGVSDNLYSVNFDNSGNGVAGGTSQTILISTDTGASWSISQTGFFGGGFWAAYVDPSNTNLYVFGENSIFQPLFGHSTNNGLSWNWTAFYFNNNEGRGYDIHFFDSNNGIACGSIWTGEGGIARTTNNGSSWTSTLYASALFGMDFPSSNIGFAVGLFGYILKTTDGGITWSVQTSPTPETLEDVDFVDNFVGYAVGTFGKIIKTEDGGVIPVELTSFTASVNGNSVILNWQTATETNNSGFEVQRRKSESESKAAEWESIGFASGFGTTTEPKSYSFIDELSPDFTDNLSYRLKQIDYNGTFEYSDIVEVEISQPESFNLEQNYPNPFNPTTKISFSIPENSEVSLIVYNVLGQEVSTLVEGVKAAGRYEVEFDASGLSSGIYYYQLKSGKYESTRKMILLR